MRETSTGRRCRGGASPRAAARRATAKRVNREPWFLYVLECADRSLYVGIAKSVEARLAVHNAGRGARYTRTRLPARLLYTERLPDVGSALRREREVKRWSRPRKVKKLGLAVEARMGRERKSA